jgi:hypothetical protein
LKRAYPEDEHYQVSHETIYRSLYVQARGVLKKELIRHLRSKRTMRRPRRAGDNRGQIVDLVSISKRPAMVEDRAVPGHWERRSVVRIKEQLHRDLGRTADALRDTGEGRQQGYPNRSFRADQASEDDTELATHERSSPRPRAFSSGLEDVAVEDRRDTQVRHIDQLRDVEIDGGKRRRHAQHDRLPGCARRR